MTLTIAGITISLTFSRKKNRRRIPRKEIFDALGDTVWWFAPGGIDKSKEEIYESEDPVALVGACARALMEDRQELLIALQDKALLTHLDGWSFPVTAKGGVMDGYEGRGWTITTEHPTASLRQAILVHRNSVNGLSRNEVEALHRAKQKQQ